MNKFKSILFKRLSPERADWTFSAIVAYVTAILIMFFGCLAIGRLDLPDGLMLLYFLVFMVVASQFILMALVFNLMGLIFDATSAKSASEPDYDSRR